MPSQRGPRRLTPAQARQRITRGHAALLDVRETYEWTAGHAPDAAHAPLTRLLAGAALPPSAQGRPIIVICRSGNRSRQAVEILANSGVEATDVTGGMVAWAAEGLPVVDDRGDTGFIA
ncbi:rhodanese-like domain-containing protein [Streptomyces apocyni]|uniref:rhodanese-like domain-containing protein n=1 Tax=Streptomyces apocyni TaxID=2654677 RepID=UPI0012EAE814|nr:rhodanese-like domain-containing protein [Streptomyces apocyni]